MSEWVKSGQTIATQNPPLSALVQKRTNRWVEDAGRALQARGCRDCRGVV